MKSIDEYYKIIDDFRAEFAAMITAILKQRGETPYNTTLPFTANQLLGYMSGSNIPASKTWINAMAKDPTLPDIKQRIRQVESARSVVYKSESSLAVRDISPSEAKEIAKRVWGCSILDCCTLYDRASIKVLAKLQGMPFHQISRNRMDTLVSLFMEVAG